MKFKKVLFSIFMMFLSTLVVYADAPDSITINGSNLTMLSAATYLPNYNEEGLNVTLKQTTDGKITYCINPNRDLYTGVMTYNKGNKITDSRVLGVLVNGYNYGMNTGNSGKDYFITNLALWTIVEPSSYKLQGVNCNANTYNGTSSTTVASACALATQTYTPPTSSISVNNSNVNMTLSGDYYVTSSAIGVNLSSNATSYTVTLGSGAPTGAVVTDSAGNTKTTFNKGESFKVKVPKSSVTSTTSFGVTITATYQDYAAYEYNPTAGNSYQSVALLVTESSTKSANLTLNITVEAPTPTTTTIKVFKYIYGTTTPLSGASFALIHSSGSTVDTWGTTNSNPHTIANLSDGAYTLREYAVPNGYEVDNINSVIVVNNGSVRVTQGNAVASGTSIIIYNRPEQQETKFSVRVIKADFNYEVLSGASFELRDSQNVPVERWTSDTNAHTTGLLSPGVYTLYEVLPPSGYMTTGPISFRLGTDGSVVNTSNNYVYPNGIITVFNDLIPEQVFSITLVKRDAAATSTLLSGAVFKLQKAGETARTLSFNTNTSITVSNLTPGSYTLTEETAPSGYVKLSNAITFNISSTGTITNLSGAGATLINNKQIAVDNSKVTASITLVKRDAAATSTLLSGAVFKLQKAGETARTLSFNTNTSITVSNLTPGSYTLTEETAPSGYVKLSNAITFNISNTGTITNLSGTGATLINNKQIAVDNSKVTAKITIIKKDAATNGDLTGAKFKLQKTGETTYETLTFTTASVIKNLTPGTYTLTETEAPQGYLLDATPIKFIVRNDGVVTNDKGTIITGGKIIVHNEKEPVVGQAIISKRDVTTGEELPGAHLKIVDSNGDLVLEWTSTETPKTISDLAPGTYTLSETIAPDGYIKNTETITFTIGEDGKVVGGVVVMNNEPRPVVGKVVISKIDATTSKELPGATLTIKDSNGDVVDRWTSTSTPHTVSLAPGTYTLTEVSAPKKYILNKEVITFTVGEDGTVSGKVIMKNYPDEVKENAQTGGTIWIIVIIAGLLSLGYALFIFLRNNKNKSQV